MKKWVRSILFLTILAIVITFVVKIYTVKKTTIINDWSDSSTIANFYYEEKDSLDVLILGTSTMSNGVQPAILWNEQQITSYNLSIESQHPIAAYYILMEALRYQHPKVVVLNARWLTKQYDENLSDTDNGFMHIALDYLRLSKVKILAAQDAASRSENESPMDYILPFYQYHNRDDLSKGDFNLSALYGQHQLKGSSIQFKTNAVAYDNSGMDPTEVPMEELLSAQSDISLTYMEKMIDLCKKDGVKVLLLSLPLSSWDWENHQKVQAFADDYNVSFLDMNTSNSIAEMGLDFGTDYQDPNHENISGSIKTSDYLAKYLVENYELNSDHSEAVAASFNTCCDNFMSYYPYYQAFYSLTQTTYLEDYLKLVSAMTDDIIIISARDEFTNSLSDEQKSSLNLLGLKSDFSENSYRYSYIAIIDSGEIIYEECSPNLLQFEYRTPANKFIVTSAGMDAGDFSSIMLNENEYSLNQRGLNIIVYNKSLGIIADSVNFDTYAGKMANREEDSAGIE